MPRNGARQRRRKKCCNKSCVWHFQQALRGDDVSFFNISDKNMNGVSIDHTLEFHDVSREQLRKGVVVCSEHYALACFRPTKRRLLRKKCVPTMAPVDSFQGSQNCSHKDGPVTAIASRQQGKRTERSVYQRQSISRGRYQQRRAIKGKRSEMDTRRSHPQGSNSGRVPARVPLNGRGSPTPSESSLDSDAPLSTYRSRKRSGRRRKEIGS